MEKEFVPYELSVKLKALGFDEPCFNLYHKDTHQLMYKSLDGLVMIKIDNHNKTNHCSAPTFSQAFRFIMQFPPLNKWRCNIALYSDGTYSIKDGKDAIYEYLSLESCLEKLIEIVESKEK